MKLPKPHQNGSATTFDAVFLDFYGTVAAGDREAIHATCEAVVERIGLAMSGDEFARFWGERFFVIASQSNHDEFRTLRECEEISLVRAFDDLGIQREPWPFIDMLEAYWSKPPIYDDAVELLESLTVPVCCVSNADTAHLLSAIRNGGLQFDAVVSSEDVRCYKPEEGIFRHALDIMGVNAGSVLHIGDSLHSDVGGAMRAGIHAAWVCRDSRVFDIGGHECEHRFSTLTDLRHAFGF